MTGFKPTGIALKQHERGIHGVRPAPGVGAAKTSRVRVGGAFILEDMFRFADSVALAVAGPLSAALASGQPGQPGLPGGARG
jgi:hypothetical protein